MITWPRGYKIIFMLNSVEHEILNAHKYTNIKKSAFFKAQISVGILIFISRKIFMLS